MANKQQPAAPRGCTRKSDCTSMTHWSDCLTNPRLHSVDEARVAEIRREQERRRLQALPDHVAPRFTSMYADIDHLLSRLKDGGAGDADAARACDHSMGRLPSGACEVCEEMPAAPIESSERCEECRHAGFIVDGLCCVRMPDGSRCNHKCVFPASTEPTGEPHEHDWYNDGEVLRCYECTATESATSAPPVAQPADSPASERPPFADDPTWNSFQQSISDYRDQVDASEREVALPEADPVECTCVCHGLIRHCMRCSNQPCRITPPATAAVEAREIVRRISNAALELAFVRHDLTSDEFDASDHESIKAEVQARKAWWETIKEDVLNCLTGDDFGCLDPEELDATNCELIWLTERFSRYLQLTRSTISAVENAATEIFNYVHETDGGHKADFVQRRVIAILSRHFPVAGQAAEARDYADLAAANRWALGEIKRITTESERLKGEVERLQSDALRNLRWAYQLLLALAKRRLSEAPKGEKFRGLLPEAICRAALAALDSQKGSGQ